MTYMNEKVVVDTINEMGAKHMDTMSRFAAKSALQRIYGANAMVTWHDGAKEMPTEDGLYIVIDEVVKGKYAPICHYSLQPCFEEEDENEVIHLTWGEDGAPLAFFGPIPIAEDEIPEVLEAAQHE